MMKHWFTASDRRRLVCAAVLAFCAAGRGDVIAKWDFSSLPGGVNNFGPSPMAATAGNTNVTIGGLTRGGGIGTTGTGGAKGWGGNGLTETSQANAITGNDFATFSITGGSGLTMSLTNIAVYNIRHSGTGPTTGIWQYKVGAGSFADIGSAITWGANTTGTGNDQAAINLSGISALQNLSADSVVTFRIVSWGGSGSAGTWYFNDQTSGARDLIVNGTVAPAPGDADAKAVAPATQIAAGEISSSATTPGTAIEAFAFTLQDMGIADTLGTKVTQLTVKPAGGNTASWAASIQGVKLYNVSDAAEVTIGTPVITDAAIVMPIVSGNLTVPNGGSKELRVSVYVNGGDVTDGSVLQFRIDAAAPGFATDPSGSSRFAATFPADITGSAMTIRVVATPPITIFHVNDTHARLTPHWFVIPEHGTNNAGFELVGGAACLATEVMQTRSNNPGSLFLDAGDISEGNPIGDMNGNGSMVGFYNLLDGKLKSAYGRGIDASVVGNHDVRDLSYITNLQGASYPVISMNICSNGTHNPFFKPYVTVTVNGKKVGILGYTTGSAEVGASVDPIIDVVACDWNSSDTNKIHVADYVRELRTEQHCDLVVLLAHVGQSAICVPSASTDPILVDDGTVKVPEIVVSGHWHTWASTVWQPEILNYKTIFTESASYMKYLGELTVDGSGRYLSAAQHVLRVSDIPADPDVAAYVGSLKNQYNTNAVAHGEPQLDDVIGYTSVPLFLDNNMKWWSPDEYPWSGDNTAGEWICDAMQWKAEQIFGTSCDLALEAGGGVRADVPAGPVTLTQIYETFPWNDDLLTLVRMTGQEIWNFVKANNSGAAMSKGWLVTSHDGVPVSITINGQPIELGRTYKVAINNYMYDHPTTGFTYSDSAPSNSTFLCRQAIIDYTAQFTSDSPMTVPGPRYELDTEFSGGYRAVVTMMNDADSSPSYEDAFIRLLNATPETLARRGSKQVPADLVNADGTVNQANRLAEAELYRSFLGFKTGVLTNGSIIEVWGKNSAYQGNPEFVDQEGIYSNGVEFKIVGYDPALAQPKNARSIRDFWNDGHKNHYVKFLARKTGANTVADQNNTSLTVMDVTAYAAKALPGSNGELLQLTGVPTSESFGLRFRCDSAVTAASIGITNFPPPVPSSSVQPVLPDVQTNAALTLTAAMNAEMSLQPSADAQVVSGKGTYNYGTNTYLYVQSANSGSYGNERSWLKFDLSALSGTVTGARLKMYCWKAAGASLPVAALGSSNDAWTETGLTWNNQPDVASAQALSTNTLAGNVTGVWYSWDVLPFVQSQLSGDKTASFALKAVTEDSADTNAPSYGFEAREYSSNQPYLEVDATGGAGLDSAVTNVAFFYRYSSDNLNWGAWTATGSASAAPWNVHFDYPRGFGWYEFYSVAFNNVGDAEDAPALADADVHYTDDANADGIPDAWETANFGSTTNVNPNAVCSNGINTVREAYIAGLNPNDPQSALRASSPSNNGRVIGWNAVSGRVYNVYWTTNLLSGFQCLGSNIPWTQAGFTNAAAVPCGYYKIDVRLNP